MKLLANSLNKIHAEKICLLGYCVCYILTSNKYNYIFDVKTLNIILTTKCYLTEKKNVKNT